MTLHRITTGILIGGQSRRMGRPKALISVDRTTLIERTVNVARWVSDEIVLLGEPTFDMPDRLAGLAILPDPHPGIGPIGGLESLLRARPNSNCLLLACDMPHLNEAVLRRLVAATGDFDAAVCRTIKDGDPNEHQWHPCCGLYRTPVLRNVQKSIAKKRYSLIELITSLSIISIDLKGEQARAVSNWNVPEDVSPDATARNQKSTTGD